MPTLWRPLFGDRRFRLAPSAVDVSHDHDDEPAGFGDDRSSSIDDRLRKRVNDAMADFERCLDAAVAQPSPQTIDELREATDRLMRAAARVLIELDRGEQDMSELDV